MVRRHQGDSLVLERSPLQELPLALRTGRLHLQEKVRQCVAGRTMGDCASWVQFALSRVVFVFCAISYLHLAAGVVVLLALEYAMEWYCHH